MNEISFFFLMVLRGGSGRGGGVFPPPLNTKEKILNSVGGVPVCYSAQLMMGNPGYIFF